MHQRLAATEASSRSLLPNWSHCEMFLLQLLEQQQQQIRNDDESEKSPRKDWS